MTAAPAIDEDFLLRHSHLLSPAHLAMADSAGKWMPAPHLWHLNREVTSTLTTANGRLAGNMPFQHGKTELCSKYAIAWRLLTDPTARCGLCSYSDTFAAGFGAKVRDIVERWGPALGIRLRKDSRAKDEWVIEKHGGGLVCRGRGGAFVGRPIDNLFLDDLIKDAEEALSRAVLDSMWDWYCTVAYSRLGPTAPIVSVGTRWGRLDWFARVRDEAKRTGEPWRWVIYKAIAEAGDPLGRSPGAALWPERVPLDRLQMIAKERGRWFRICWQQDDQEDQQGKWLRPAEWPRYHDLGNLWQIERPGMARRLVQKNDCIVLFSNDWAWSIKKKGDSSSIIAGAVTPPYLVDGSLDVDILLLEARLVKVKPEQLAPECDAFCQVWRPRLGGFEEGHPTLKDDVQRFRNIPPIQWFPPQGKDKLARAFDAIVAGQRGRILLPMPDPASRLEMPWMEEYITQLRQFTGDDAGPDTDDHVDGTSWLVKLAREYRPEPQTGTMDPGVWAPLTPGRDSGWKKYPW